MKIRTNFVSNSSSSSFILPKKSLTEIQIRGLTSWVNIHNDNEYSGQEDHYIHETTNYFFGSVSYHCGLEDQLEGLGINSALYDLEE